MLPSREIGFPFASDHYIDLISGILVSDPINSLGIVAPDVSMLERDMLI